MYRRAEDVLPTSLLREIQKYVQGEEIYIPKRPESHLGWGEANGTREQLARRNQAIARKYAAGASISQLMDEYHLSYDSIRKIVRQHRR